MYTNHLKDICDGFPFLGKIAVWESATLPKYSFSTNIFQEFYSDL